MSQLPLRIGFVPLINAAPLIAALELGYFAEESLDVSLHRKVGWGNIRDDLSAGEIDAALALEGMPLSSYLGRDLFAEPLVALMSFGAGKNTIVVRKELYEMGVTSARGLGEVLKSNPRVGRPIFGHAFGSSIHHYLLREWLSSGGVDPDQDVQLCIIPASQMVERMKGSYVDLICAGEPWKTLATGVGVPLVATEEVFPRHPEQVLTMTRRVAMQRAEVVTPMIRAILRACAWCDLEGNRGELAGMLATENYLEQPAGIVEESLLGAAGEWLATFPNKMHSVWMLQQMIRWKHLHPEANVQLIAEECTDTRHYRAAALDLGVGCPQMDFAPMELRNGTEITPEGGLGAIGRQRKTAAVANAG